VTGDEGEYLMNAPTIHDAGAMLQPPERLRDVSRSLAALSAIQRPGPRSLRDFWFDPKYRKGTAAGLMRTGSGDGYLAAFSDAGAVILGFDHESPMSPYSAAPLRVWPGVLDELPVHFADVVTQLPEFMDDHVPLVTFCTWREPQDDGWRTGEISFPESAASPDGSEWLLALLLDPRPEAYVHHQQAYGRLLPFEAVKSVYHCVPATQAVIRQLNPEADYDAVARDLVAIGYPVTGA
jgi:hypothetical protein